MAFSHPIFGRAFWPLVFVGGVYIAILGCLTFPEIQKQAIYMHKLQLTWRYDLTRPEQFGYAKNQVTPFYIDTEDGEQLFSWHVLPLGLYAKHRDTLVQEPTGVVKEFASSASLKLLRDDPEARLVIHYHGNAGTVGAVFRPLYTRAMSAANPDKLHVLMIDYRGYGYSTGKPSEEGLIKDGLAAVRWAMDVAKIPAESISIVGQSLGSAVTLGVAERLASSIPKVELGSVITVAGFSSMPVLVKTYNVAGYIPVLSPLSVYPKIQKFFIGFVREAWDNEKRLQQLIKASTKLNLFMIHAKNDNEIPPEHCNTLFYAAANATLTDSDREKKDFWAQRKLIDDLKQTRDFGAEGYQNIWPAERLNGNKVEQWVVSWGEHNRIMASAPVSLIIAKSLGL